MALIPGTALEMAADGSITGTADSMALARAEAYVEHLLQDAIDEAQGAEQLQAIVDAFNDKIGPHLLADTQAICEHITANGI